MDRGGRIGYGPIFALGGPSMTTIREKAMLAIAPALDGAGVTPPSEAGIDPEIEAVRSARRAGKAAGAS